MNECFISEYNLTNAYHKALQYLDTYGEWVDCPDYNTKQLECSMTIFIKDPLAEPMISKLFFGGPQDLQQYVMEMVDGILDFEIEKGNWKYTYHDRMVRYQVDNQIDFPNNWCLNQLDFIIYELKRNPDSRRAVIDVRDNSQDMYSDDPACLQHIQFFIRDNKLHMKVLFRSNDMCKAFFMNAFALIKIQEYVAKELGIEVGTYTHRSNSMHCYFRDFDLFQGYIDRINQAQDANDLCYYYQEDWEDLMNSYIPEIKAKVQKLKGEL